MREGDRIIGERDELNRASAHLDRAASHTGDAAHHTKEAMEAGAAGTMERTREAVRETGRKAAHLAGDAAETVRDTARDVGHKAGHLAAHVRDAEPDVALEKRANRTTENVLHKAGDALQSAAPVVGRGAEMAVSATGTVIRATGGVLGFIVGKIAGRVGGWWNSASHAIAELPQEEEQACRLHFEAYELRPAGLEWDTARTAYTVGYLAAENPDYRERSFEQIEPDLRYGFGDQTGNEYDALRDFTRYGYERGRGVRSSQPMDRPPVH